MACRLSSLEFLLSVVSSLLLLCCVGLITVSWISLKPGGNYIVCSNQVTSCLCDGIDQYVVVYVSRYCRASGAERSDGDHTWSYFL